MIDLSGAGRRHVRRGLATLGVSIGLAVGTAIPSRAQSAASSLITAARSELEAPNPDAAAVLLERALEPGLGATPAEQTRAWVLYGIAQLMRDNAVAARAAFRQALQRDPSLRVDSLTFFTDALEREFNAERVAAAATVVATVLEVQTPLDTAVAISNPEFPVTVRVSRPSRVVAAASLAEDPSRVLWADTEEVRIQRTVAWSLRTPSGQLQAAGRYLMRTTVVDSAGGGATDARLLDIARVPADTAPMPPPLQGSAFAAETRHVHPGSLLWLVPFAGAAVICCSHDNHNDTKSFTFLSIAVASLGGFFVTHRTVPDQANIQRNQALRERDARERAAVVQSNVRARDSAPIRIRMVGTLR